MVTLDRTNPDGTFRIRQSFRSVLDALRFKSEAGFGPETRITSLREPGDPGLEADALTILGDRIRDSLRSWWWSRQLDRLCTGEIRTVPENLAEGLAVETAVFGAVALFRAGLASWAPVSGVYHHPDLGPMPSRVTTAAPVSHAWLIDDRGLVMDLTGTVFPRCPSAVLMPADDRSPSFIATGPCVVDAAIRERIEAAAGCPVLIADLARTIGEHGLGRRAPAPAEPPEAEVDSFSL